MIISSCLDYDHAYRIGSYCATPWFSLAIMAYPIWETLFSMYRRKILRGKSAGHPDALHMHQLIYQRLARIAVG